MKTGFYYRFWLNSRGQSYHTLTRFYKVNPSDEILQDDLVGWFKQYSHLDCSYGYKRVLKLPKNRRDALKKHGIACNHKNKWAKEARLLGELLGLPPFNGQKP